MPDMWGNYDQDEWQAAYNRVTAENERLRTALEVYADRRNWLGDADEVCNEWWRLSDGLRFDEDGWATAEAALRAVE